MPAPSEIVVTVELLGTARLLAGERQVVLRLLEPTADLHAVVRALAECCPSLVGSVLDISRLALTGGHVFNVNGRDFVRDPATAIHAGDRVLLLSSAAGG